MLTERDKILLRKAYEHGKSVATYRLTNLPERYAPYTYETFIDLLEEELEKEDAQALILKKEE